MEDRYQVRENSCAHADLALAFEVVDAIPSPPKVLTWFSSKGDAEAAAVMLNEQYDLWKRGEDTKRAIRKAARPQKPAEEFELDPPEGGFFDLAVTGYHAPHVDATRIMKYSNDLAPASRWNFSFYYPGQDVGDHEMIICDEEVSAVVVAMSQALTHLHEVHDRNVYRKDRRETA